MRKCRECGEKVYALLSYKYEDEIYCEDCLGDKLFTLENLIAYIDSDEDLMDEIYIEDSFGVKLEQSSPLLREYCRKATIEDWACGSDFWQNYKKYAYYPEFLEFLGAERITKGE